MDSDIVIHIFFESRNKWLERNKTLKNRLDCVRFLEDEDSINSIINELINAGFQVFDYEINTIKISDSFDKIQNTKNSIIWNLTDGNGLYKGSNIPAVASLSGIPYIGSGSYVQMLAQNKYHMKNIVNSYGIPIAESINICTDEELIPEISFPPPYFIKPTCFDNGIGDQDVFPICDNIEEIKMAMRTFREINISHALVEEFLPNDEYSVVMINGGKWTAECVKLIYDSPFWDSAKKDQCRYSIEVVSDKIAQYMIDASLLLAKNLDILDYFRVDFRCDKYGVPKFLELNTNPFLMCKSYNFVANKFFHSWAMMLRSMVIQSFSRQHHK